jgi:ketosteroid isomerase-like protein
MSQENVENVEIVRNVYEAFNDYGVERLLSESSARSRMTELVAPDIEIDLSRNVFNPVTDRGYEGVERLLRMVNDVWDDFRFEVEQLIDAGEQVVAAVRLSGKGKGSGAPVDQQDFHVFTLRDGKVVRQRVFHDRAEALEAAGLSE